MGISICYIDEAGCTGMLPSATSAIQPALVISALIIDLVKVPEVTNNFIKLKVKYFPGQFSRLKHDLDALMVEIKGADVRADLRRGPKQKIQQRQKFLDDVFALLDNSGAKLVSRIWIKGIGQPFNGRAIYTTTAQRMAALFQNYLKEKGHYGAMIGDFREPRANSYISHSVFTQKYKRGFRGDAFPNLIEVPTFGISDNHAGLQLTDLLTSAIIWPIATYLYCTGFVRSVHVNSNDRHIHSRFRNSLKRIQYAPKIKGAIQHGITVNDPHAGKSSYEIFR
jgi:Protein of unknown function (DUF3800)